MILEMIARKIMIDLFYAHSFILGLLDKVEFS